MMTLSPLIPLDPEAEAAIIGTEVRQIIALFEAGAALDGVTFPDVGKATFDVLSAEVLEHAQQVAAIRHQLNQAKERLAQAQSGLSKRAERAVAYARVFAAGDAALADQLDELELSKRLAATGKKARRRRKSPAKGKAKKADTGSAELPLVAVG